MICWLLAPLMASFPRPCWSSHPKINRILTSPSFHTGDFLLGQLLHGRVSDAPWGCLGGCKQRCNLSVNCQSGSFSDTLHHASHCSSSSEKVHRLLYSLAQVPPATLGLGHFFNCYWRSYPCWWVPGTTTRKSCPMNVLL